MLLSRAWHSPECRIFKRFLHSDISLVMALAVSGANLRANNGHWGPSVLEYSGTSLLHTSMSSSLALMNCTWEVLYKRSIFSINLLRGLVGAVQSLILPFEEVNREFQQQCKSASQSLWPNYKFPLHYTPYWRPELCISALMQ